MLFLDAINGFAISLSADRYSPQTISAYRLHLSHIATFLNNPDVSAIDTPCLRSYFAWLNTEYKPHRSSGDTRPLAGSSVGKSWIAMRSFFGWCESESIVSSRPDLSINKPEYETEAIVPFSQSDVKRLLRYCASSRHPLRDRAILLTLLDTGLRAGELCRLRVADVDLESGCVTVRPFGSSRKSRPRSVYLGKSARRALWRYISQMGTIVPKSSDDFLFSMTPNGLRLLCCRLGDSAGVANCHPHRFRHTFALNFLKNGGSAFALQRALGHASLAMTSQYVLLSESDLASIAVTASPVDGWRL